MDSLRAWEKRRNEKEACLCAPGQEPQASSLFLIFWAPSGLPLFARAALPPVAAVKTGAQATWAVQTTGHVHQCKSSYWTLKGREA